VSKNPAEVGFFVFVTMNNYPGSEGWQRTAVSRQSLWVTVGAEWPVRSGKLPFPKQDFLQYDVPESANSSHLQYIA